MDSRDCHRPITHTVVSASRSRAGEIEIRDDPLVIVPRVRVLWSYANRWGIRGKKRALLYLETERNSLYLHQASAELRVKKNTEKIFLLKSEIDFSSAKICKTKIFQYLCQINRYAERRKEEIVWTIFFLILWFKSRALGKRRAWL